MEQTPTGWGCKTLLILAGLAVLAFMVGIGWRFADNLSTDARGMLIGFVQAAVLLLVLVVAVGGIAMLTITLTRRQDARAISQQPQAPPVAYYNINPPPQQAPGLLPGGQEWPYGYPVGLPAGHPAGRQITILGDDQ